MVDEPPVPVCAGCGAEPPETSSDNTLVSKLGWRLRRYTDGTGALVSEWRCAACWVELKKRFGGMLTPHTPFPVPGSEPKD